MKTDKIKKIISKSVRNERTTHSFAKLVKKVARQNGKNLTNEQADGITEFVIQYVESVPALIEQGIREAPKLGIQNEMNQMMLELKKYWILEQDLVPDSLGLIGITDDAYASLYLLQTLSDYCQSMYNRPLMKIGFTNSNKIVRELLGNNIAAILEQRVQATIGNIMVNNIFNQSFQKIFNSGFAFTNPFAAYNQQREIEEQVNVQMGAMGIF